MMDNYLKKFSDKYDVWLDQNLIDSSSRVIPIHEAFTGDPHIMPTSQAESVITKADFIALADCVCRGRYQHCEKPTKVCLLFNETGKKWVEQNRAEPVNAPRAVEVLKQANESGLVHMTLFKPDHEIFALCSCCDCCCHDLQLLLKFGKTHITAKSDFIARDDTNACINCGECVDRCPFNARQMIDDRLEYQEQDCYGCGLCITTCPENAISLVENPGQ
jgi:ferredoxin